eukprot:6604431-Pyramimonas_sp.AAC.1
MAWPHAQASVDFPAPKAQYLLGWVSLKGVRWGRLNSPHKRTGAEQSKIGRRPPLGFSSRGNSIQYKARGNNPNLSDA